MTIWYKQGTSGKLNNQIQKAKGRVAELYASYDEDLFVTCLCEGNHSLGTLHEFGDAIDFRYSEEMITEGEVRKAAGPGFDFEFHDTHIHMEYDPKDGDYA